MPRDIVKQADIPPPAALGLAQQPRGAPSRPRAGTAAKSLSNKCSLFSSPAQGSACCHTHWPLSHDPWGPPHEVEPRDVRLQASSSQDC